MNFFALFEGFFTAAALIMAIGAQNLFLLKQGIKQRHVLPLVLFFAFSDALLITLGTLGFANLVLISPWFSRGMAIFGIIFLGAYGARSFWYAFHARKMNLKEGPRVSTKLSAALALAFAFTYLNPHAYLDTLVLLGSISSQYILMQEKIMFTIGAIAASFAWFFSLGYGARLLARVFEQEKSWQILDIISGVIMWGIAVTLIPHAFLSF